MYKIPSKQQGAVLVISIIILLILTFIAISTLQTSPLEEKIASNYQQLNLSFQAADSVEREAETYINNLVDTSAFTDSNGLYSTGNAPDPFDSSTWSSSYSRASTQSFSGVNTPRYFIELIGTYSNGAVSMNIYNYGQDPNAGAVTVFRIVVHANDASGTAENIVQSFYGRRF